MPNSRRSLALASAGLFAASRTYGYGPRSQPGTSRSSEQMPGDGDTLDQVAVLDGRPVWRRVWPTPPENPDHGMLERWMTKPGHALLAGSTTS